MSYELKTDDADKLRYVMGRLRGRPGVAHFTPAGPEPDLTVVVCLHTATDGAQELILCFAEDDFDACKTLAGRVQFYRVFRRVLVELHPDTTALFHS